MCVILALQNAGGVNNPATGRGIRRAVAVKYLPSGVNMRLSKEQVEKISKIILDNLKTKELIVFKVKEEVVLNRAVEIFLKDLKAEDELDREVEEIIKGHAKEIEAGRMDYRKMFNLIKAKLVKERNIVL